MILITLLLVVLNITSISRNFDFNIHNNYKLRSIRIKTMFLMLLFPRARHAFQLNTKRMASLPKILRCYNDYNLNSVRYHYSSRRNIMLSSSTTTSIPSSNIDLTSKSVLSSSSSKSIVSSCNNNNNYKPLLISLEGNIGAGKSTLLAHLKQQQPHWMFIDEPLNFWTSVVNNDGKNLLETFYGDCARWSFTFQACALLSRFKNIESQISQQMASANNIKEPPNGIRDKLRQQFDSCASREALVVNGDDIVTKSPSQRQVFITERSLDTDYEVFTKMLVAAGHINKLELTVYKDWFDMLKLASTPLSAVIFLNEAPESCLGRIRHRGRAGEDLISLQYLQELHGTVSTWLRNTNVPVLEIGDNTMLQLEDNARKSNSMTVIDDELRARIQATNDRLCKDIVSFVDNLE